jgi:hypothetical protein
VKGWSHHKRHSLVLGRSMKKSLSSLITLVILSLFAVSCGGGPSNVLSGVKVSTTTQNGDVYMSFAADLDLGAMSFATISLPILHPRGQTPIGHLELVSGFSGQNQIKVSVNLSEVADVQTTQAVLPNGNMIPLIANNQTIAVEIGRGARLYLTLSETVTAIGVAVPVSAFDSIGRSLPGLNFFPIVNTDNVVGTAGIFTGAQPGQSGIAVIADVSRIVNLQSLMPSSSLLAQAEVSQEEMIKLDYSSHRTSSSKKRSLDNMIYKLNKQRAILRMR